MKIRLIAPTRLRRERGLWGCVLLACLILGLTVQPALAAPTLWDFTNPGFESWSGSPSAPVNWYVQPGGTVQGADSPHSGALALYIYDSNTNGSSVRVLNPGIPAEAPMDASENYWYRFAAWAQSDRGAASPALIMWFTNDAGTMIGTKQTVRGDAFGITSSMWKQMSIVRRAPLGATKVVVQLGMYGGTPVNSGVRFDDAQLDEVNADAGETDVVHGWTVERSADLGSGFGPNLPTPGVISFTAPGGNDHELNGAAWVSRTFTRPIESLSFRVTSTALGDPARIQPIVWGVPNEGGPAVVLRNYSIPAGVDKDDSITGLNTKRIVLSGAATHAASSDPAMNATFSNIRALSPVWRFLNKSSGVHMWTADPAEKASIEKNYPGTWKSEGTAYRINVASIYNQAPLWRFVNINGGFHLYTADASEKDFIRNDKGLSKVWRYEGEAYRVSMNKTTVPPPAPVWRIRNLRTGTYVFTSDSNERNSIVSASPDVWDLEGIAYYLSEY